MKYNWPKRFIHWTDNNILKISIPFTWELPEVFKFLTGPTLFNKNKQVIVGGPAVYLIPGYFDKISRVSEGKEEIGVLQRIQPLATRTSTGCVRKCKFCAIGIGKVESGGIKELQDYPDLPIITDNNLLATSKNHFDKVIDKLIKHKWADFNQGIDSRLLTEYHAKRISEIKKPTVRLALDHMDYKGKWEDALNILIAAGIKKSNISSYCLIGFNENPRESWIRCEWIKKHKITVYPMWYHHLFQLEKNIVTDEQKGFGWTEQQRLEIMGYYYMRRGHIPKGITNETVK